jgi:gliding motility-associated-like protein
MGYQKKILFSLFLLFYLNSNAQLIVDFYISDLAGNATAGGCSPLIVRMNDRSTNNGLPPPSVPYRSTASGNSYNSHTWEFGTSPPSYSNLQNPVFGYVNPGTYTVTLIVNNGTNTSTFTQTVTVYPVPIVDFSGTPTVGCQPLNVCFTDLTTSGNLAVTNWTWDFGNGAISSLQNPCYTFLPNPNISNRCFNITLIATNSQGCTSSASKSNYICLTPPPVANFYSNQRLVCSQPYSVSFFDSSISTNGLSYLWNFGDGTTSTVRNPIHTYANPGTYSITLTIRDTICNQTGTITKTNYIRVGSIDARFVIANDTFCAGTSTQFFDSTIVTPSSWLWDFGGAGTSVLQNPSFTFNNPGNYNIRLTVTNNIGCTDDTLMLNAVVVNPVPTANITSSATISCRAPFSVSFNSNATGATGYLWDFGDMNTSPAVNPVHTYTTPGNYTVRLTVRNNFGCTYTTVRTNYIQIAPTQVNFDVDNQQGCAPLTANFTDRSTSNDPIVSWQWNFGDPGSGANNTSTLQNPSHVFQNVGSYNVTLTITTQTGCTATTTLPVNAGNPPPINFSVNSTQVCVNVPLIFTNLSGGSPTSFRWDFGGVAVNTPNATYTYDDPGVYTVTFEVGSNGCISDTSVVITVLDPKADFTYLVNCNLFGRVTFTNTSTNAHRYSWAFGDNTTSVQANPVKTYLAAGVYSVTLTAYNDSTGCSSERVQTVTISNTRSDFIGDTLTGCVPLRVNFTDLSTGNGLLYDWAFGDGGSSTQQSPTYVYNQQGTFTVTLRVTDVNGCTSTMPKVNYIRASDVNPDFNAQVPYGCLPKSGSPATVILFQDLSVTPPGATINNWNWNFGNGTQNYALPGSPPPALVSRAYNAAGLYDVSLTVTTNLGCRKTITKAQYIDINQPMADFYLPYNLYCPNQTIQFNNVSTGESLTYLWNFGDNVPGGGASINPHPLYAYVDTGYHTVTLIITDIYGCKDTMTKPNMVYISSPDINFNSVDTFRYCPPHLACFTNLSSFDTIAISSILWDFGDNTYSSLSQPCHIYSYAGLFAVDLQVRFANGCVDSFGIDAYINVGGAVGDLALNTDSACLGDVIFLNSNSSGAVSHVYIFGDGSISPGDDTISHTYLSPGVFVPSVILSDTQIPTCSYVLYSKDTLLIDTVFTNFGFSAVDTVCSNYPVTFTDSSTALIVNKITRWHWDFGDGDTSNLQNPVHVYRTSGVKTITLTAYNEIGCFSSISKSLFIIESPTALFTVSDSLGCDSLDVTFTDASIPGDFPINFWRWDFGDPNTLSDTSRITGPHNYYYPNLGTYNASLVVADTYGCRDTSIVQLYVYPIPNGIVGQDTIDICFGDSVVLNGDPSYAFYDWTPGINLSDSTIAQPTAYAVDTITYYLITTDFTTCQSIDSVTINVIPLPPLVLSPYPDTNICLFDTVQLFAAGSIAYEWNPPVEISDPFIPNPFVYPTTSRYYTVTTTDPYGCKSTDRIRVIINHFYPDFEAESACLGSPTDIVSLSSTSDRAITQYLWDFGDNSNPNDQAAGRVTSYTYPDSGFYNVTLVILDAIGCSDTIVKQVRVDIPPDAFAGSDTLICYGASVQLFSGGGVDSVYWTPERDIDNAFIYNPTVTPGITTNYTVHVTNGNCPFDTANVLIKVVNQPIIETIEDRTIFSGTSVQLFTTADNASTIIWTPSDSLSCSDCLSPVATPLISTLYIVTVYDEYGCYSSDSVLIMVTDVCSEDVVFVGNTFTPNGDGLNDVAFARLYGAKSMNFFRVFDRWGKLLFESRNPNTGWDGTNMDGEKLITGVYVYVVEAQCYNGQKIIKKGNITLLK